MAVNNNHIHACVFCKIVEGTVPAHVIWESEKHLAFLSIFPNTEGFSVVIPKIHYGSYAFAQSDQVLSELILATKKVAQVLDSFFHDVERCGMFFEGYGVDHLHAKLFPMHGTADDSGEWQMRESTVNKTFYDYYPGFLSSNDSYRADDALLEQLAAAIRTKSINY